MRYIFVISAAVAAFALIGSAQDSAPYRVTKTVRVGGAGGFDYVDNDTEARRLYIARSGATGARIGVFDLDTLAQVGEIKDVSAHGAVVSPKSGHGFTSSKPVVMFDAKTLATIKTIEVGGNPDGMKYDPFNDRVWVFSHSQPHATVINAADGAIVGTLDLGGQPEQAATDGKGHIYVDIEDKENIAVVDATTLTVTAHYDIAGKGGTCAGLALDVKNGILFAACRNPANMVILRTRDGKVLTTLPIGTGTDGAAFNADTMEAFSSQGDGTLTVIRENSPTSFEVAQTVKTMPTAKTLTLDTKTGRILLIGAQFGPAPVPPPAGGRAGRGALVADSFTVMVVGK